ncbi:MAG: archaetidylserine decarboxylase [Pseudomonadota bacterium]
MKTPLFIIFQHIAPQHLLSRLTGWLASSEIPWLKDLLITRFVRHYHVNLSEAKLKSAEEFESFNAFFTRELEDDARTINTEPNVINSPCDGAVSELGQLQHQHVLQAKGQYYSLETLLANDDALCERFLNGTFITCYLSPKDYHRVHAPIAGTLVKTTYVPGDLFSVNGTTAKHVPNVFARNERLICEFDTKIGTVVVILVGAFIVAGIETVWSGHVAPSSHGITTTDYRSQNISLDKGDELGRFKLGSTAIVLFPENSVALIEQLSASSALRLGEAIATIQDNA